MSYFGFLPFLYDRMLEEMEGQSCRIWGIIDGNSRPFFVWIYGFWSGKIYPNQKNHRSISDIISEISAFWSWGCIVLLAGVSCLCTQLNLNYGKNITVHLSNSHSKCKKLSQRQFCNEVSTPSLRKEDHIRDESKKKIKNWKTYYQAHSYSKCIVLCSKTRGYTAWNVKSRFCFFFFKVSNAWLFMTFNEHFGDGSGYNDGK